MKRDRGQGWRQVSGSRERQPSAGGRSRRSPVRARRLGEERRIRPTVVALLLATGIVAGAFVILLARHTIWLGLIAALVVAAIFWLELRR